MLSKFTILLVVLLLLTFGYVISAEDEHGHDHGSEAITEEAESEHNDTGTNDEDRSSDKEYKDQIVVELTPEAIKLAGIVISSVKEGRIGQTIELPGEVGFNEDRVAHIAPRFAGIALHAKFRVGDYVKEGEIVAIIESNESMNSYSIKAPISGWIIERHITTGEYVSEENSIYVIVDLSTVWVNLAVYPKDIDRIKKGQVATIKGVGSKNITAGTIEYVTPVMDLRTRSLTARITLSNIDNKWLPGSFVQATITTDTGKDGLVVEKNAVQYLDKKNVLFVVDGTNRFVAMEVITGDSDDNHIQIISDLHIGTKYVSSGAFELKAKLVTSNLDAHAGHGH